MTTTQELSSIKTAVIRDGKVIGMVTLVGATFRAARQNGTAADARRVAYGFRTIAAACRFIEAN